MPEFNTSRDTPMKLEMALLVYNSPVADHRAITRHNIKDGEIQPGETIDLAAMRLLLEGGEEAKKDTFTWRSPYDLAESATRRVWWTPAGVMSVFIAGKAKRVWFPNLIWCAHRSARSCYLWTFVGKKAPTKDTIVYRPAFGPDVHNHIHKDSAICLGSMNPGRFTPKEWMAAFFDSNFKTDGNLPPHPYEIRKAFKKIGSLSSALSRLGTHE